jgi:hypothetical protein
VLQWCRRTSPPPTKASLRCPAARDNPVHRTCYGTPAGQSSTIGGSAARESCPLGLRCMTCRGRDGSPWGRVPRNDKQGEGYCMSTVTQDFMLPSTVTGSWPRPRWFDVSMRGRPLDTCMLDVRFCEKSQDAMAVVASDQERAGLDMLSHGDFHCDEDMAGRSWHHYPLQRCAACVDTTPARRAARPRHRGAPVHGAEADQLCAVVSRQGWAKRCAGCQGHLVCPSPTGGEPPTPPHMLNQA